MVRLLVQVVALVVAYVALFLLVAYFTGMLDPQTDIATARRCAIVFFAVGWVAGTGYTLCAWRPNRDS